MLQTFWLQKRQRRDANRQNSADEAVLGGIWLVANEADSTRRHSEEER